jgi:hypothetical protein
VAGAVVIPEIRVDLCKCLESLWILGAVNFFSIFFNQVLDEIEGGGYDGCVASGNAPTVGAGWQGRETMTIITHTSYRLSMTSGETHDFGDLGDALDWALRFHGCHSSYDCEDGRVLLYQDDEAMESDESGGAAAMGGIDPVHEEEEYDLRFFSSEYGE